MSGRGQLREHSSLTRSLILAVVAGIQLARRETLGGFQCLAIREFNYANHGQLNDSSNNRLSAERCLFIDKTCLLWHLVVFTDRYGNRAITCLSDVPPRESSQKKQKKKLEDRPSVCFHHRHFLLRRGLKLTSVFLFHSFERLLSWCQVWRCRERLDTVWAFGVFFLLI